jgi:hypothetical protein
VLSIDTGVVYITPADSFELIAHQTGRRAHLLGD